jgi:chromosome segregation ATPase
MLNLSSHDEMLQGKSKNLEEKLKAIQDRYEMRFQTQEVEMQKLRKENTMYRHENEMIKIELADLKFRVTRSEQNEKDLQERLTKANEDFPALLSKISNYQKEITNLTIEKDDAEDLLEKKRLKLKIAEDRIRLLEDELKERTAE